MRYSPHFFGPLKSLKYTITTGFVIAGLLLSSVAVIPACSSKSTTPSPGLATETSGDILYSRFRDANGNVIPVLSEGGGFDGAEVDSPEIVVDGGRAGGDKFMMFYEAQASSGVNTIGLVTSDEEDFVNQFVQRVQVVGLGAAGSGYETGATDPAVIRDKRLGEETRRYKMWFEGRNGAVSTIIYATSADGLTWSGFTKCAGLAPSFGSVRVADPTVVLNGATYQMWFEAINTNVGGKDGPGVIGYAESSDGINWTIKDAAGNTGGGAASVFGPGASGGFDGYSVNAPSVVMDTSVAVGAPGRYKLWYEAGDNASNTQNTIGYATSADGLTWSRSSLPVLAPSSDLKVPLPFDSGDLEHPSAAIIYSIPPAVEGRFLLWYTGDGEGGASPNRIGLVKGWTL